MVSIQLFITLVFVGTGAGMAAGLFGVGGGIVTVPFLLFLTPATFQEAVAASLLVITLTTPVGLWQHHRARKVAWRTGGALGAWGLLGVAIGFAVNRYLNDLALEFLFAAFLLYAAKRLAFGATPTRIRPPGAAVVALTGVTAGAVAKLLGIGGGILIVPGLVLTGLEIHTAVATSLVSVLTNAAVSTGVNLAWIGPRPWVEWGLPVAAGSVAGIYAGSHLGLRSAQRPLQRGFALVLVVVAASLVRHALV
jgi:uncharacterized protein